MILFLFYACGQNYGNKLESSELDVFYTDRNDEDLARNVAVFWKQNDLLGKKKQFLQLSRYKNVVQLKLIPSEKFDVKTFSFDERSILISLQDSLRSHLDNNEIELVIADQQFKTLYNINQ